MKQSRRVGGERGGGGGGFEGFEGFERTLFEDQNNGANIPSMYKWHLNCNVLMNVSLEVGFRVAVDF